FELEVAGSGSFCPFGGNPANWCGVAINGQIAFKLGINNTEVHACLGDWGYDGHFEVRSFTHLPAPSFVAKLDHLAVVPSSKCPRPGEVFDGDFEAASGWVTAGTAEIASGLGTAGSKAGHLFSSTQCDRGTLA